MLKKIFLILFALFGLTVSHAEEKDASIQTDNKLIEKTYIVSIGSTGTGLDEPLKNTIKLGDAFSVFDPIADKGQKFVVTSIFDGKAAISGTINKGDFKFSAIYPYEAVSAWKGSDAYEIEEHPEQVIPYGQKVDPEVLIAGVFDTDPGRIIEFSLLYSPIAFKISRNDISEVSLNLSGIGAVDSETYTIQPESGLFPKGEYFALVKTSGYDMNIATVCHTIYNVDFTRIAPIVYETEKKGIAPLNDICSGEKKVHYTLTGQSTLYGAYDMYQNSRYPIFISKFTGKSIPKVNKLVKGFINLVYPASRKKPVNTYTFEYTTSGIDGNPITLSAKMYIPQEALSSNEKLKGLMLINRATLTKKGEEPTESEQIEAVMTWSGYAVVMPDGYGFGSDSDNPQAFLNTQMTGKSNIDGIAAAQQIIKDLNIPCEDVFYNSGYSQGGTCAMATLKYSIDHPEEQIHIKKSFIGGGAYDFELCYDDFVSGAFPESLRFIILSIISINESEKLGLDYSHIFKEPLLSNYEEIILSKQYDVFEIMDKLGNDISVSDFLDEGMIDRSRPEADVIIDAMKKHDLAVEMTVPEENEVYIFHSTTDNFVPYENFTHLQDKISGKNVHFYSGNYGTHFIAAIKYGSIMNKNLKKN